MSDNNENTTNTTDESGKTQEELDMELAMRLQAEESGGMNRQHTGGVSWNINRTNNTNEDNDADNNDSEDTDDTTTRTIQQALRVGQQVVMIDQFGQPHVVQLSGGNGSGNGSGSGLRRTGSGNQMQWLISNANQVQQKSVIREIAYLKTRTISTMNLVNRMGPLAQLKMRVMNLMGQRAMCEQMLNAEENWDEALVSSQEILMEISQQIELLSDLFGISSQSNTKKAPPKVTWDDVLAGLYNLQMNSEDIQDPDTLLREIKKFEMQANKLMREDKERMERKKNGGGDDKKKNDDDTSREDAASARIRSELLNMDIPGWKANLAIQRAIKQTGNPAAAIELVWDITDDEEPKEEETQVTVESDADNSNDTANNDGGDQGQEDDAATAEIRSELLNMDIPEWKATMAIQRAVEQSGNPAAAIELVWDITDDEEPTEEVSQEEQTQTPVDEDGETETETETGEEQTSSNVQEDDAATAEIRSELLNMGIPEWKTSMAIDRAVEQTGNPAAAIELVWDINDDDEPKESESQSQPEQTDDSGPGSSSNDNDNDNDDKDDETTQDEEQEMVNPNQEQADTVKELVASLRANVAGSKINQLEERLQHFTKEQESEVEAFEERYNADIPQEDLISSIETRLGMLNSHLYAIKEELSECEKMAADADAIGVKEGEQSLSERSQELFHNWEVAEASYMSDLVPLFDAKTNTMRGGTNQYNLPNGSAACTTVCAYAAMGLLGPTIRSHVTIAELIESEVVTPELLDTWVFQGVEAHPVTGMESHLGWTFGLEEYGIPSVSESYKELLETVQEFQGTTDSSEEMNIANIVSSIDIDAKQYGLVLTCNGMSVLAVKMDSSHAKDEADADAWLFFDSHGMPNIGVQQTYLRKFDNSLMLIQFLEKRFPYMAVPDLGSSLMFNTVSAYLIKWK
eukprot:TRINITY_DN725_c0_g2_i1.p1 TRINITY_DN725_c0_g2~~TRINITY_DN725_c0_g2_i1.p1  ORF type:complete len:935 (+),score=416.15 TRINITY_DN725_c0_g2_i1:49-2805(+)